jgi:Homeodomain-like domain
MAATTTAVRLRTAPKPNNAHGLKRHRIMWEAHQAGRSYADIGAEHGISKARVARIVSRYRMRQDYEREHPPQVSAKARKKSVTPKLTTPKPPRTSALTPAFYGYDDLAARGIKFSRWHLLRMVKAGDFPAPVARTNTYTHKMWSAEKVERWIEDQLRRDRVA